MDRRRLYDRTAPDADDRLELLRFFAARNVPLEEITEQHRAGHIDRAAADHFLRVERTLTASHFASHPRCPRREADRRRGDVRRGDPSAACHTALDIIDDVERHPVLTGARGAIAFGDVLSRDGDYFRPVVNQAARAVKVPGPGQVLATDDVTTPLDLTSIGVHPLRGVAAPTELFVVSR